MADRPKRIHTHPPGKAGKNLVRPDPIALRHVGLNEDGFKSAVTSRLVATRCTVDSSHTRIALS